MYTVISWHMKSGGHWGGKYDGSCDFYFHTTPRPSKEEAMRDAKSRAQYQSTLKVIVVAGEEEIIIKDFNG